MVQQQNLKPAPNLDVTTEPSGGGVWTGGKWYKVRDATTLWKDTPSGVRLFAAGGIAGAFAKTAVAPLERIKMLLQVRTMQNDIIAKSGGTSGVTSSGGAMSKRVTSNSIIGTARSVLATDGVAGFWRGNFANTVRIVPTKGILFMVNDSYKELLHVDAASPKPLKLMACGALSGMTATIFTYPLDLIRSRLMMAGGEKADGMLSCASGVLRNEGVRGFYAGLAPTLAGIIPYAGISFGAYGFLKSIAPMDKETGKVTTLVKLTIGATAGVLSQTASFPIDTVRRRMQLQGASADSKELYDGAMDCARQIYARNGVRGFYSGLSANVLRAAPNTAVQFMVYESATELLGLKEEA